MTAAKARIEAIDEFWAREFALYLHEHRHPLNRMTHMVGVPLLLVTLGLGLWLPSWGILLGGQVVGWAIQIAGHRIEGNRPALLKRPISFLMGPLMVLIEFLEPLGVHPRFVRRAREAVGV